VAEPILYRGLWQWSPAVLACSRLTDFHCLLHCVILIAQLHAKVANRRCSDLSHEPSPFANVAASRLLPLDCDIALLCICGDRPFVKRDQQAYRIALFPITCCAGVQPAYTGHLICFPAYSHMRSPFCVRLMLLQCW